MKLSHNAKRCIIYGLIFAVSTIAFTLLWYYNVIKTLDLFTTIIYVAYFVGLALFFNAGYIKEKGSGLATGLNYTLASLCLLASTGLLIYGFINGNISIIN